jgi:hypothetical protein
MIIVKFQRGFVVVAQLCPEFTTPNQRPDALI